MEDKKTPITILIPHLRKSVVASQGDTILNALLVAKVPIDHSCGGMGSCGTCLVHVEDGFKNFEARNELETEMCLDRGFKDQERLACQNVVCGNMQIKF